MYTKLVVGGYWDMEVREMKFLDTRFHFDKLNGWKKGTICTEILTS